MGAAVAQFLSSRVQLLLYAVLIIPVAVYMWWKSEAESTEHDTKKQADQESNQTEAAPVSGKALITYEAFMEELSTFGFALLAGFVVGVLGGGFMTIPVLIHMGHKMDTAFPTSFVVVLVNALVGMFWYNYQFANYIPSSAFFTVGVLLLISGAVFVTVTHLATSIPHHARLKIFASLLAIIGFGTLAIES